MKFSKLRILSILMAGAIALGGCSGSAPSEPEEKRDTEDITLTVAASSMGPDLPKLASIIYEYGSNNDIDIELVDYSEKCGEGASQKLSVELMSGRGPDILVNPGMCFHTVDIHKIMSSGVFADLGPLLDLEGKEDRYFTKVLDSGKYEDEQLVVPLFFSIRWFVSTRNVLEKNHFDINQCGTYDGFLSELNNSLNSVTAPPPLIYEQRCDLLFLSDAICEPPVIDYNNRTVDFSQPKVQKTYEFTKDLMDRYPLSPYGDNYNTPWGADGAGILKSGKALFLTQGEGGGWGTLYWLKELNPWIEEGDQLVMTALRRASDDSVITYEQVSMAANRNSCSLEAAAEFINYLLSDIVQCSRFDVYMPVYKQGVEARIRSEWWKDMPEYLRDAYRSVVNDAGGMQFNHRFPADMYEMMEPYYLGKESYDSCISKAENRFSIFVDE